MIISVRTVFVYVFFSSFVFLLAPKIGGGTPIASFWLECSERADLSLQCSMPTVGAQTGRSSRTWGVGPVGTRAGSSGNCQVSARRTYIRPLLLQSGFSGHRLSGPLNRLNAILSLLQPLDRYRTRSAIGSAIGGALSRPISHPRTGRSSQPPRSKPLGGLNRAIVAL